MDRYPQSPVATLEPVEFSWGGLRYADAMDCEALNQLRECESEERKGKCAEENSIVRLFETKEGIEILPTCHDGNASTMGSELSTVVSRSDAYF